MISFFFPSFGASLLTAGYSSTLMKVIVAVRTKVQVSSISMSLVS